MHEAGERYFLNLDQERWKRDPKNATVFEDENEAQEIAGDWGDSLPYPVEVETENEINKMEGDQ